MIDWLELVAAGIAVSAGAGSMMGALVSREYALRAERATGDRIGGRGVDLRASDPTEEAAMGDAEQRVTPPNEELAGGESLGPGEELREEDVTRGDRLDDRVEEGQGLEPEPED